MTMIPYTTPEGFSAGTIRSAARASKARISRLSASTQRTVRAAPPPPELVRRWILASPEGTTAFIDCVLGGDRRTARGRTRREPGRRPVMTVGVIGLGYVGLPLAVAFAEAGCDVVAVDVDARKIESLAVGESYIEDVSSEALRGVAGRVHATSRYADLARADAVLVCVPTPLTANREPDLGPLVGASGELGEVLQAGQLVVLESTTYPGTTRERVAPLLQERSGLVGGPGLSSGVLAGAGGPGPDGFHAA